MNILMLNYEYPPLGGGAGNATYYILQEFAKTENINIDLVTSSISDYKIDKRYKNITIHYLNINKKDSLHSQSVKDLIVYSKKAYFYSKRLKKNKKFDLIHAFLGIPCGYIAMKLKLPYIVSLRGSDVPFHTPKYYYLDKYILKNLSKKIWEKAKYVAANSKGLKEEANKSVAGQKIEIIYNGIDTGKFKPPEYKPQNSKLKIISVGRLARHKGYNYLIEALLGIQNLELTLIGDGKQFDSLSTLAENLKVNVIFKGRLEQQDIVKELQKSDIFILPSLTEGMSNALLEAMACGLPVIATNVGGSKELVDNNGFIIDKANAKLLREKIIVYKKNKQLIIKHGGKSREKAESMSWRIVADEYIQLYKKTVIKI